jgi:hypothetical protein
MFDHMCDRGAGAAAAFGKLVDTNRRVPLHERPAEPEPLLKKTVRNKDQRYSGRIKCSTTVLPIRFAPKSLYSTGVFAFTLRQQEFLAT